MIPVMRKHRIARQIKKQDQEAHQELFRKLLSEFTFLHFT